MKNFNAAENEWIQSAPARFFRSVLAQYLPIIIVVFLVLGVGDYAMAHPVPGLFISWGSPYSKILASLLIGQLAWNLIGYPLFFNPRRKGRKAWRRRTGLVAWAALVMVVILIVLSNFVAVKWDRDHTPAVGWVAAGTLAIWLITLWITAYLGKTSPVPPQRQEDSADKV